LLNPHFLKYFRVPRECVSQRGMKWNEVETSLLERNFNGRDVFQRNYTYTFAFASDETCTLPWIKAIFSSTYVSFVLFFFSILVVMPSSYEIRNILLTLTLCEEG
jgi:hypothetical protein